MILFILSFIAGVLTVLAPCTLPLLPVIVGSSVSGVASKRKAFVITASLGVSIVLFTLLLKFSSIFINIPQDVWAVVSGFIIIIFGLVTLIPEIWEDLAFVGKLNASSNRLLGFGYKKESFWGDVIIGVSLGPVFSSCSPTYFVILATVLPQSFALGLLDLIVYAIGLSGTLLLISLWGQKLAVRLGGISDTHGWFRRILGFIFVILGISIVFGFEKRFEARLLESGIFDITKIEQTLLKLNDKSQDSSQIYNASSTTNTTDSSTTSNDNKENVQRLRGPKAPEIVNPSGFINTDDKPITIGEFRGKKVVLLDIWTYSCINCQRTIPYINEWYKKYKDMGLVVIGLHTPEFAFERVKSNVEEAADRFGIQYPIVMDNEYSTWTAFGNQYWPRKYLINEYGEIVYDHIGEGSYEETEKFIQRALSELNSTKIDLAISKPQDAMVVEVGKVKSPEIYFGSSRNEYLANGKRGYSGQQSFSLPTTILSNVLYLQGIWNIYPEYARSEGVGKIVFKYNAKNVYMVASGDNGGVSVKIMKDGVLEKTLLIQGNKLYNLIDGDSYGEHTLEIETPAGLNAFTFTFG